MYLLRVLQLPPCRKRWKERLRLFGEVFGFETSFSGEYPGWSYKEESPVRQVLQESYRELFGEELKVEANPCRTGMRTVF